MKSTMFFTGILSMTLVFVLGLILTGCPNEPEPETPVSLIQNIAKDEQVYQNSDNVMAPFPKYTDSGTVKLKLNEGRYKEVGTITKGKLTITLPDSIENNDLIPLADELESLVSAETIAGDLTVNPSDAKGLPAVFAIFAGETEIGSLNYVKQSIDSLPFLPSSPLITTRHTIEYMYFPQPTGIITDVSLEDFSESAVDAHVDGNQGWNKLYMRISLNISETATSVNGTITSNLENIPSNMQWVASSESAAPIMED
ncbi:MAG: hypothetical protein LBD29_05995 [Treponema sp.]|jgi:hypothetical protein|nr:hypothetical protein [Treponema sp.]